MEIKLRQKPYDEVLNKIFELIDSDSNIQSAYSNHKSRICTGAINILIECDGEDAGYISLTDENTRDFLFLDIGIIKEYRGKGISELALRKLLCNEIKQYLIAEIKQNNIPSNRMANSIGVKLYDEYDKNFYLLQKEKEEELKNNDLIKKLKLHRPQTAIQMMDDIIN